MHDLVYSKKKELIWNKDTTKALGIYFHSQIKQVLELNYKQRIENFRKDITIWKKHKLTTIRVISQCLNLSFYLNSHSYFQFCWIRHQKP